MPFRIFISHNVDNHKDIAKCLQDHLRTLSKGIIECEICTQQPGGTEWRTWIQREVSRCDLFLYVYTSDCVRQEWLLFEAGVFLGARQRRSRRKVETGNKKISSDLICLKSPGIPTPPQPIEHLQAYEAEVTNLRRFLVDLLVEAAFNPGDPINDRLLVDYVQQLKKAIEEIKEAFERASIQRIYYRKCLEVGPIDPKAFESVKDGSQAKIPPDTPVMATELARELIGLPASVPLIWQRLLQSSDTGGIEPWIEELQDVARAVYQHRAPQQILTPFFSTNHRICNPVVFRIDRVQLRTHKLSVLFIEHERAEDSGELTDELRRAPENFRTMIRMMNLTRRTRWNVIEAFKNQIGAPIAIRHDISTLAQEFSDNLERLEREAQEAGWLNPDKVKVAFDKIMHDEVDNLFQLYGAWRESFDKVLAKPDEGRLIGLVDEFAAINKRFWLIVLDRYEELVDGLAPRPIKSTTAEYREMAKAEVWKNVLGEWEGIARDVDVPGLLEFDKRFDYKVTMQVRRDNRGIRGTLDLTAKSRRKKEQISTNARLEGSFARGNYFAITYRVASTEEQRFGIMLIKLADTGKQLRGLFLSKKAFEEGKLGFGQIVMVRRGTDIEAKFTRTPQWMRKGGGKALVKKKPRASRKSASKKKTAERKVTTRTKIAPKKKARRKS